MDGILKDTERNPNYPQEKDKENYEYAEEENDTQDTNIEQPEEEIILDDD